VSKEEQLQRLNLAPLRRLDASRTVIMENVVKPYFEQRLDCHIHKNMTIEIDDYEFYVKYSRPFFGKISEGTEIKIDSSVPKNVQVLRIAPIWDTEEKFEESVRNLQAAQDYLRDRYLLPYFYCGFMCFVEKGETILIDNQEFFVNDCKPKNGIVDAQTVVEIDAGFTQEVFKKKQVLADMRYAEKMQARDSASSRHQRMRVQEAERETREGRNTFLELLERHGRRIASAERTSTEEEETATPQQRVGSVNRTRSFYDNVMHRVTPR